MKRHQDLLLAAAILVIMAGGLAAITIAASQQEGARPQVTPSHSAPAPSATPSKPAG